MNDRQSGKFIKVLEKAYGAKDCGLIFSKMTGLNEGSSDGIFFREFEFSLVEDNPSIRILHLEFYDPNVGKNKIGELIEKRKNKILNFLDFLAAVSFNYDKKNCAKFFDFNQHGTWPIQVGIELGEKIKAKIYLSINNDKFDLEKFCQALDLNYGKIRGPLAHRKLDTVAIDLTGDGGFQIKIYPMEKPSQGWLWRLSKDGSVASEKRWIRLSKGLLLDKKELGFIDLPETVKDAIIENKLKISYFCSENKARSIYVR